MSADLMSQFVITDEELLAVVQRVGIQSIPAVLAVRPQHDTEAAMAAALDRATVNLVSRGLIVDGLVAPQLAQLLQSLQRPDRELAMRLVTPDGIARVTVVRDRMRQVLVRRVGDELELRTVGGAAELDSAAGALLSALPEAAAADIPPVGAPLEEINERLTGTNDSAGLADQIRALGAEPQAAMLLGSALASRMAFAEIVCYTLSADDDRITRAPAAVGVFYTKRGRIVGAPSCSPSGQIWSTLKGGSDHSIKQAISQLVELSGERWGRGDS